MSGKLYVVGTPIGNLEDFSERAQRTLREVDFIAAEDTRVTVKLLNRYNIKNELVSYHEHNKFEVGGKICDRIEAGEDCAVVTDAGMPGISDPGNDLVRLCQERGIAVNCVPGPTALTSALAISGINGGRFTFEGFLSVTKKTRFSHLEELKNEKRTMVFYEAPHKLVRTLSDLYDFLGNRQITIVRELTKIHEEVIKTTLLDARELYDETNVPKGEFVLIVEGANEEAKPTEDFETVVEAARNLIKSGVSINDAAKQCTEGTPYRKSDVYKILLQNPT